MPQSTAPSQTALVMMVKRAPRSPGACGLPDGSQGSRKAITVHHHASAKLGRNAPADQPRRPRMAVRAITSPKAIRIRAAVQAADEVMA